MLILTSSYQRIYNTNYELNIYVLSPTLPHLLPNFVAEGSRTEPRDCGSPQTKSYRFSPSTILPHFKCTSLSLSRERGHRGRSLKFMPRTRDIAFDPLLEIENYWLGEKLEGLILMLKDTLLHEAIDNIDNGEDDAMIRWQILLPMKICLNLI